jgi:hypothetical protein
MTITTAATPASTAAASSNVLLSSPITNPSHASTTMQNGQAVFENDNYKITADDNNTVTITNKHTGAVYQASGDPHVSVNGQHKFDFWGTTTFNLDDGTKVTIQTTPYAANPNADLSSKVTITNGSYGVQITGVDSNTKGDLAIHEAAGWGNTLDWAIDDGNEIYESAAGNNLVGLDAAGNEHAVDQNWINATDILKNPNANHNAAPVAGSANQQLGAAYRDAFRMLDSLVSIVFRGAFNGNVGASGNGHAHADHGGYHDVEPQRPRPTFEPWIGGGLIAHADLTVNLNVNVSLRLGR